MTDPQPYTRGERTALCVFAAAVIAWFTALGALIEAAIAGTEPSGFGVACVIVAAILAVFAGIIAWATGP